MAQGYIRIDADTWAVERDGRIVALVCYSAIDLRVRNVIARVREVSGRYVSQPK